MLEQKELKAMTKRIVEILLLIDATNAGIKKGKAKKDQALITKSVNEKRELSMEMIALFAKLDIEAELNEEELLKCEV